MRSLIYVGIALWIGLGFVLLVRFAVLSAQMTNHRVPDQGKLFYTRSADYTEVGQQYRRKASRAWIALLIYAPTILVIVAGYGPPAIRRSLIDFHPQRARWTLARLPLWRNAPMHPVPSNSCQSVWADTAPCRTNRIRSNRQRAASAARRIPCSHNKTGRHWSASSRLMHGRIPGR
jgi:hypothetical protein